MQINPIGYQPNFKAKFIKNEAIINAMRNEISQGRIEHLEKSMAELSKHHKNVALLYSDQDGTITNMYNGNTTSVGNLSAYEIEDLSNIHSSKYKQLFDSNRVLTPKAKAREINRLTNLYLMKSAPDYTYGHKLDKYYNG